MSHDIPPAAADRARALFGGLVEGRWEETCQQFAAHMRVRADPRRLALGWARAAGSVGGFARMGDPAARQAGEYTVVDVPLAFAAGQGTERVAYDRDGKVAGLSLQCRRHRLDPRRVSGFALRSPGAAEVREDTRTRQRLTSPRAGACSGFAASATASSALFVSVRLLAGPKARQVLRTAMVASFGEVRWH